MSETGPERQLMIGGLIQIRKIEPIYPEATSLSDVANGFRFEESNQGIPDGVPRQV